MKKFILPKDPYGSRITLLYGTRAECNRYLRRALGVDHDRIGAPCSGHTTEWTPEGKGPIHYVSVVKEHCSDRFVRLAVLAHELLHVTLATLEFRGVKITSDNDEPVTYYFEWLFRLCAREVW